MKASRYSIHPLRPDPGADYLWCILPDPDDGTPGFVIGDLEDLAPLRDVLDAAIKGKHGDEISPVDQRLGFIWVTVPEALEYARLANDPVSRPLVTRACRLGQIEDARRDSRGWVFPRSRFLAWLGGRKRIPGPAKK
jgi:hypothetical protein